MLLVSVFSGVIFSPKILLTIMGVERTPYLFLIRKTLTYFHQSLLRLHSTCMKSNNSDFAILLSSLQCNEMSKLKNASTSQTILCVNSVGYKI